MAKCTIIRDRDGVKVELLEAYTDMPPRVIVNGDQTNSANMHYVGEIDRAHFLWRDAEAAAKAGARYISSPIKIGGKAAVVTLNADESAALEAAVASRLEETREAREAQDERIRLHKQHCAIHYEGDTSMASPHFQNGW